MAAENPEPTDRTASLPARRPARDRRLAAGWTLVAVMASGCQPDLGGGDPSATADRPGPVAAVASQLPESRLPATQGLDPDLLDQAYQRAAELPRLHSLLVARHGELLREEHFGGPGPGRAVNIKSASKSVLSALVGIAIAEGHLAGLDQPIAPFFPEIADLDQRPRLAEITVGHLLSMQAGLEPTSFGNYGRWVSSRNWVRYALERPFVGDPGGRMLYSTGNSHLLSALLTRVTGRSTLEYAREKLGGPLGFPVPAWTRDPQGVYFGGNEMSLRPRDLLAFGELYRNGGRHGGEQVIPEEWIRESWVRRTTSPFNGHGYGLGWWTRPSGRYDVHFAWGYGGQYVFVVPDLELTVVTTSDPVSPREGGHNRAVHRLLDEVLIPAAEAGAI